jgi:hypothetical protein
MSSSPPTTPSRRPWSLWDGPKCLHTGTVVAPSDADGLRTVLLGAEATGRVPLDPRRHYRVRCGSAVASAAGDEFVRTSESSSMPDDAPAHAAKAERERVEAEAKRLLERELAERLTSTAYDPAARTSRPMAPGEVPDHGSLEESLADWATPRADGKGKAAAPKYPPCTHGTSGEHDVRELELTVEKDPAFQALAGRVHWSCRACGVAMGAQDSADYGAGAAAALGELADRLNGRLADCWAPAALDADLVRRAFHRPGSPMRYAVPVRPRYVVHKVKPGGAFVYAVGGGGAGGASGGSGNASASSSTHPGSGNGNAGGGGAASGGGDGRVVWMSLDGH